MKELLVSLIKNIEIGKITAMGIDPRTNTPILVEHASCIINMGAKTFFIKQSTSHAITKFKVDNVIMHNLKIGSEDQNNIIRYLNPIVISNKNSIKDAFFYDNFRLTFEKGSEFAEKSFKISEEKIRWEFFKALLLYLNSSKEDLFFYNQNWGNILYQANIEVEKNNEFLSSIVNDKADISLGGSPYKTVHKNFLNIIKEIPTSFSTDIMNKNAEIIKNQSKDNFANFILNNKIYFKDDEKFIENIKELHNFLGSNAFNLIIATDKNILDKYEKIEKGSSGYEEEKEQFNEFEGSSLTKRKPNVEVHQLEQNVMAGEAGEEKIGKLDIWDDLIKKFFE